MSGPPAPAPPDRAGSVAATDPAATDLAAATDPAATDPAAAVPTGLVDVVFLAWREAPAVLARHHAAVAADLGPRWSGRAVLVENAAGPRTSEAARRELVERYPHAERVVLRARRNLGFARAIDLGLDACAARYVLVVNSDGRPEPGMTAHLVAALEAHPEAVWAAPGVHGDGEPGHPPGPAHAVEELAGTALLVRRQAFAATGGFDPLYFFYREDHDASVRLRAAGLVLLRVPDARFHHDRGRRSAAGSFWRELHYARAGQVLAHQHASRPGRALVRFARRRASAVAGHASRGNWPAAAGIAVATLALPSSLLSAARRRRRPWDGDRLADWLVEARRDVEVVEPRSP